MSSTTEQIEKAKRVGGQLKAGDISQEEAMAKLNKPVDEECAASSSAPTSRTAVPKGAYGYEDRSDDKAEGDKVTGMKPEVAPPVERESAPPVSRESAPVVGATPEATETSAEEGDDADASKSSKDSGEKKSDE